MIHYAVSSFLFYDMDHFLLFVLVWGSVGFGPYCLLVRLFHFSLFSVVLLRILFDCVFALLNSCLTGGL